MKEIELLKYKDIDVSYKNLIKKANVFFSEEMKNVFELDDSDYYFAIGYNLIMPIVVIKKYVFKYCKFISEPLIVDENIECNERVFLNSVIRLLSIKKVQWSFSNATCFFHDVPDKSISIPFGSNVIYLDKSEEVILANMHSKHRNVIKRSQTLGVKVNFGKLELLYDYIKIDQETWKRSKQKTKGIKYYEQQLKFLDNKSFVAIAYYNDTPQAGAIVFYNEKMGYYMYGASANKPIIGSANLLQWEIIKALKEKNVYAYSFVGYRLNVDKNSKYEGIQRFKERFGGELISGYLFKYIHNNFMYKMFRLIKTLTSFKIYEDAIDQEKHKWV